MIQRYHNGRKDQANSYTTMTNYMNLPSTSTNQNHIHPIQCKYENLPQNGHNENFSVMSYILKSCQEIAKVAKQLFAIIVLRQFVLQICL
jgi:hypothetical protein